MPETPQKMIPPGPLDATEQQVVKEIIAITKSGKLQWTEKPGAINKAQLDAFELSLHRSDESHAALSFREGDDNTVITMTAEPPSVDATARTPDLLRDLLKAVDGSVEQKKANRFTRIYKAIDDLKQK